MTSTLDDIGGWPAVLGTILDGEDLPASHTHVVMATALAGEATDAQIAAFIMGIRQKGETTEELTGMVLAMYDAATPLDAPDGAIDIVGMGGSRSRRDAALNVSTMACFVAAAAGAVVCKHGNRKASSTSGSFDLLEALGANFDLPPERLEQVIRDTGVGFAFARTFHPAMKYVGPVRAQLGIPTVFNVLGPLANPARVTRQVVGVADERMADRMIEVLRATGSEVAWVVTGEDELDELSTSGPSRVRMLIDGEISLTTVDPSSLGIAPPGPGQLAGGDAQANAAIVRRVFSGEPGAARDIVLLNAAAGLVVAGIATDIGDGFERAAHAVDTGAAAAKLDEHIAATLA